MKLGAGEDVDFKQYEAGMRLLLDTYIQADASEVVADFEDTGLDPADRRSWARARSTSCPTGIKKDPEAVAETITNNMRKVIIDERAMNPKYYDKMSELLDALIEERRQGAIDYKEYLERAARPGRSKLGKGESDTAYPDWANNGAQRALVDFGFPSEDARRSRSTDAVMHSKPDSLGRQPDEGEEGQAGAAEGAARRLRPPRRAVRPGEGAR